MRGHDESAQVLPSPPQMPPPIELRVRAALRQHMSRPGSASRRHHSAIGQMPLGTSRHTKRARLSADEARFPSSGNHVDGWRCKSDWPSGRGWRHTEQSGDGQGASDWQEQCAWQNADGPGSASSRKHDWKSEVCALHTDEGQEDREREQEVINNEHADREAVGVKSLDLRDAIEQWIDQASMGEGKALDIARKPKAKQPREAGDSHGAWLDRKSLQRICNHMAEAY